MSAVERLFYEWLAEEYPDGAHWHQDDVQAAFEAGWEVCYHARWEPVGGLPVQRIVPSACAGEVHVAGGENGRCKCGAWKLGR